MDEIIINKELDIEEQLDLLISKGIIINDYDYAYMYLKFNNYYSVMKLRKLLYEKNSDGEYI